MANLPKTFTFKIRNPERLQEQNMGGNKMELKNVKIRHKGLAKQGLENPIKFRVLAKPVCDVIFDENGIGEIPESIVDKILVDESYERVIEEIPISEQSPELPKLKPGEKLESESEKKKAERPKPKTVVQPKVETEKEKEEFTKQITG